MTSRKCRTVFPSSGVTFALGDLLEQFPQEPLYPRQESPDAGRDDQFEVRKFGGDLDQSLGKDGIQGDQAPGVCILELIGHVIRREEGGYPGDHAARPEGAQPGDDILGDIREIDPHHVALPESLPEEHVGKAGRVAVQFGEGDLHAHEGKGGLLGIGFKGLLDGIDIARFPHRGVEVRQTGVV